MTARKEVNRKKKVGKKLKNEFGETFKYNRERDLEIRFFGRQMFIF